MLSQLPPPQRTVLASVVLLAFGTLLNLAFSRLGYMPLDHSIVFDGGWRILSGQTPFKDFATPTSLVPSVIQALFFRVFGVTWFAYCLHSSLVNGAFCVVTFLLLGVLGLHGRWAFVYAALSGLCFYVSIGVPYAEQHAFFFLALALYLSVVAPRCKTSGVRNGIYVLIPLVLAFAFLSKQVPTLIGVPIVMGTCFYYSRLQAVTSYLRVLAGLLLGLFLSLLMARLCMLLFAINSDTVVLDLVELPSRVGAPRLSGLLSRSFPLQYYRLLRALGPYSALLVHASLFSMPLVLASARIRKLAGLVSLPVDVTSPSISSPLAALVLANLLTALSVVFSLVTENQEQNGFPYTFLCVGMLHVFGHNVFHSRTDNLVRRGLGVLLAVVVLIDASVFLRHPGLERSTNDIVFSFRDSRAPKTPALRFMRYQVPPAYDATVADLDNLVEFFRVNKGNFLLIGDFSILYGITGRPSVTPSLWFHPGLTIPPPGTKEFRIYEEHVLNNMVRFGVRYLVVEGEETWMGVSMDAFPLLSRLVEKSACRRMTFGAFRVTQFCEGTVRSSGGQTRE